MKEPDTSNIRRQLRYLTRTGGRLVYTDTRPNPYDLYPRINHKQPGSMGFRPYALPVGNVVAEDRMRDHPEAHPNGRISI